MRSDPATSREAPEITNAGWLPAPGVGRSSGSRALRANRVPTAHCFPASWPVPPWGSFSLTAAGQPRLWTGFPFSACANAQAPTPTAICGVPRIGQHNLLGSTVDFS